MRTRNILFAAFVAAIGMVACESILPEQQHPIDEPKTFTVQLGMSGEINVSQNPLTRFTPDDRDLYGIQVYHKPASESGYEPFAYGLFDNLENAKLELTENYNYTFEVVLIDDGKDKIFRDSILVDDVPYVGYGKPFEARNKYKGATETSVTIVSNEFTYASDKYFRGSEGKTKTYFTPQRGYTQYDFIHLESANYYYGELDGYTPTEDGAAIDIYLKHMIYGLKVEIGEFFDEGELEIYIYGREQAANPDATYKKNVLTSEQKTFERIFAYALVEEWYNQTDVTKANCSRNIDFTWTKADGTKVNWQKKSIQFTRLKETVVTLDYYEDESAGSNNISMHYDDTEMESNYTNYTIGDTQDEYDW